MKKIFALVLAVAMLSTTAFAAPALLTDTAAVVNGYSVVTGNGGGVNPDSTIYIDPILLEHNTAAGMTSLEAVKIGTGEFNNANFAVYKRTFKKGGNLVKTVTIDDDSGYLAINLMPDISMVRPAELKAHNLVIDSISVKAKKNIDLATAADNVIRNTIYSYSNTKGSNDVASFRVGYEVGTKVSLSGSPQYALNTLTHFGGGSSFGIASVSSGDLYIEGRVYDDDKIFLSISTAANKAVLKNAAYADADLRFVKLTTSGFPSNHTVNVLAGPEEFVYEVIDNVVVKSNLKWNDEAYAWVGKTMGNKAYVISDIELKVGAAPVAGAPATNPETGANDVVGVAAALAVISLVAAGAVSLKK